MEDCYRNLFALAIEFDMNEKTPKYEESKLGVKKLESTLEHVKQDWYNGLFEKAAYIFVSINKGHFFQNGNKRLALIVTLFFLYKNGASHKNIHQTTFKTWLKKKFPDFKLSENNFRTVYGWAFYNFNKAIAASTKKFDTLKQNAKEFFELCLKKK